MVRLRLKTRLVKRLGLEEEERDLRCYLSWRWQQMLARKLVARTPARHVLILPADPHDVIGSLGDDAMIATVLEHFRQRDGNVRFSFLCHAENDLALAAVASLGASALPLAELIDFPRAFAGLLDEGGFDAVVGIGADVMDGHYHPDIPRQILIAADLAARKGLPSVITGFSFNDHARPELAKYFARLAPAVRLNLRDPVSRERLGRFARVSSRLVADTAFSLKAGKVGDDVAQWIDRMRGEARQVIGFNMHPMLFPANGDGAIERAVAAVAAAMAAESARRPVAWMLVPHDYRRETIGDAGFLRPLEAALRGYDGLMVRYFEGTHPSATIKALAGRLDGVVTGRMHLAIAALGMGVPVMCAAYQGKFAGLLRHFHLPDALHLDPAVLSNEQEFGTALSCFVDDLANHRTAVVKALPSVSALAQANLMD